MVRKAWPRQLCADLAANACAAVLETVDVFGSAVVAPELIGDAAEAVEAAVPAIVHIFNLVDRRVSGRIGVGGDGFEPADVVVSPCDAAGCVVDDAAGAQVGGRIGSWP